jgi:hypothetical protein
LHAREIARKAGKRAGGAQRAAQWQVALVGHDEAKAWQAAGWEIEEIPGYHGIFSKLAVMYGDPRQEAEKRHNPHHQRESGQATDQ